MFESYSPNQAHLFPPSPRDWLPDDHLVHFILEAIGQFDLSSFDAKYRESGSGTLAYHPQLMLGLLIYGYCVGIRSSRKIAKAVDENIAFRMIAAGQRPGHRTIARFRERHIAEFQDVFCEVVKIAQGAELVSLGKIAIDGTKIKADASSKNSRTYKQLKSEEERLEQQLGFIVKEAQDIDAAEDAEYGEMRGDELPPALADKKKRLTAIREAKRRIEERQIAKDAEQAKSAQKRKMTGKKAGGRPRKQALGTPPDDAQQSLTDPDSRIMRTAAGTYISGYNAQAAVDEKHQIIVAADVSQSAGDQTSLVPMTKAACENLGRNPDAVLFDAGYRSEAGFEALEQMNIDGYGPLVKKGKSLPQVNDKYPATARMLEKVESERGKQIYKRRQQIVEPVFAWLKCFQNFADFLMTSHKKARGEWQLVCAALNLKRMAKLKRKAQIKDAAAINALPLQKQITTIAA